MVVPKRQMRRGLRSFSASGARGIVSREVEPGMLVDCLHKVARGEPWLEIKAIN
jgi:hypothetical protein